MISKPFTRIFVGTICAAALLGITACDSGPKMRKVSGTVNFNGSPIPEGDITFTPEDKALAPQQGKIKNGKYEFSAMEGKNKVEVSASKIRLGGALGAGGEPVAEEYIPENYNVNTTLRAEVGSGENKFDFNLDSKGK